MDSPDIPELAELDILTDHEQLRLRDYLRTRIEDVPYKHWVSTIAQYPQIECNLLVHDGRPVIAGTKIAVSTIIGYLTLGAGMEALQRNYPDLTQESIKQAVDFALSMLEG